MYFDDISESVSSGYVEYTIKNPSVYYETGAKVLDYQQNNIGVLCCATTIVNESIHLAYKVSAYKTLREYCQSANYTIWDDILFKIFAVISKIRENGFLKPENLELSSDKIFINIYDNSVKMICIPLYKMRKHNSSEDMWRELQTMVKNATTNLDTENRNRLLMQVNNYFGVDEDRELIDETINDSETEGIMQQENFDEIEDKGKGFLKKWFVPKNQKKPESNTQPPVKRKASNVITLRALTGNSDIEVNKPIFYIGSNPTMGADAVIENNPKINDIHCRLMVDGKKFLISDCGSQYGTFLNDIKIAANTVVEFRHSDIITIADLKFEVE